MASPKVYEVVFKTEVEAITEESAIGKARKVVAESSVPTTIEVIRDDDLFGGQKDIISREVNHIVVLTADQRQELERIISQLSSNSEQQTKEEINILKTKAERILARQN